MWQRFTERARRVILLGQEEAVRTASGHVGTEHLLLGLIRESEGVGAQVLLKMGVSLERVQQEIGAEVQPRSTGGENKDPAEVLSRLSTTLQDLGAHFQLRPEQVRRIEEQTLLQLRGGSERINVSEPRLTAPAKRALELAADESRRLRHNYIGTEHLLLALLRDEREVAARVLYKLGMDLEGTRQEVTAYLSSDAPLTRKSGLRKQYPAEQWQLVGDLIETVQLALDALKNDDKSRLEVISQKLEELKNKHQSYDAASNSEN